MISDHTQCTIVIPERVEMWGESYDCLQLTAWREFPGQSLGRGIWVEPSSIPEQRRWSWDLRETNEARIQRTEHWREESSSERKFWSSTESPFWVFSWELISMYIWGKNHPKKIRGNNPWSSHRIGNSLHFHQPELKTLQFMEHWVEYSERFCLSDGA